MSEPEHDDGPSRRGLAMDPEAIHRRTRVSAARRQVAAGRSCSDAASSPIRVRYKGEVYRLGEEERDHAAGPLLVGSGSYQLQARTRPGRQRTLCHLAKTAA